MEHPSTDTSVRKAEVTGTFTPIEGNGICNRLGDKWTVRVLWRLSLAAEHRLRFSELQDQLGGVTQRMLTLTLRNLQRDGLVSRHCYPEVPPRVEYRLTPSGAGLLPALQQLNDWVKSNLADIEANRRVYDAARE